MKVITTNLLNRFWKNGVKPIKDGLTAKVDTSKIVNTLLTTAAGFALDARQGKELDGRITALNSNFSYNTTEKTYTENGWTIRYRYIAKNKVNIYGSKVVSSGLAASANRLEVAGLPFISAYLQFLPCLLHVANTPVGYGRCMLQAGQTGIWISNTSYPTGVEMQIYGDIIVT